MACKRLKRLKLEPDVIARLERQKLYLCKDVLTRNRYELMRALEVSVFKADDILLQASRACAPPSNTCLEVLKKNNVKRFLPTTLKSLDRILHGGLPVGTVTEIAGPSGCGKTQLATLLALVTALPREEGGLGGAVLYIDTESAFSAERLIEMAENRYPEVYRDQRSLVELASKVHVFIESSCDSLLKRLEGLEEYIIEHDAQLIVVDSIASLVRKEYDSGSGQAMVRRANVLVRQAALLKYIAETFHISVVVTNQITTRFGRATRNESTEQDDVTLEGEGGYVTAALGNTWSHCVNTRLLVQYVEAARRQILVAKSPLAPFANFIYTVQAEGIVLEEGGGDHYEGTDPGLQKIRVRTSVQQDAFVY